MEYREIAAPPDLAPWVQCAWTLRGALAPEGRAILPDGRVELVLHLGTPPWRLGEQQPAAFGSGQLLTAVTLSSSEPLDVAGVRFHPAASFAAGVDPAWLREQVGNGVPVFTALRAWLAGARTPDPAMVWSAARIESAYGAGPLDRFVPDGLSPRQWERRFSAATGLTPKAFARIARLQRLVTLYESGAWNQWADLALECGFYDQAHLANDFKSFTGQSPHAFFREGRALTEFYHVANLQDRARPDR